MCLYYLNYKARMVAFDGIGWKWKKKGFLVRVLGDFNNGTGLLLWVI